MKLLANFIVLFVLSVTASCQTNAVLICRGTSSYAYHDHHCQGLDRCRAAIEKVSLAKAKSIGRTPCGYCYKTAPSVGKKQALKSSGNTQCSAITKKGTQCSRNSRSAGRCWQHGG